jgi:hypothetical protein
VCRVILKKLFKRKSQRENTDSRIKKENWLNMICIMEHGWISYNFHATKQYNLLRYVFLSCWFCWLDVICWGKRWRSWLRHCATNRNFSGSFPDGIIGFCHWHNPSARNMALGSTQPPTEMRTRNVSWR